MLINDPRAHAEIDVTGWDLDHLNELLATMRADRLVYSTRELTDEEAIALSSEEIFGLLNPSRPNPFAYLISDKDVASAIERLSEIVELAIYERDIPDALANKVSGLPLTAAQTAAYGQFLDGLNINELADLLGE